MHQFLKFILEMKLYMFHFQNKFEKLLHLVGFIIRNFVTIHGHMNVKYKNVFSIILNILFVWTFCSVLIWIYESGNEFQLINNLWYLPFQMFTMVTDFRSDLLNVSHYV
jgi:hypothetical protein